MVTSTPPPADWYPDPHDGGLLRWWDGVHWTQHTHLPAHPGPASNAADSTLSADGYGVTVAFDGQVVTFDAVGALGRGALGSGRVAIPLADVISVQMNRAGTLRNGTMSVLTLRGSTVAHFLKRHAPAMNILYEALTSALKVRATNQQRYGRPVAAHEQIPELTSGRMTSVVDPPSMNRLVPTARWHPADDRVVVAGLPVSGLVYVGQGSTRPGEGFPEPALIDPALPVDLERPDWEGDGLDYWPSYADIPPSTRAAYLAWLSSGRRHPQAPIGFMFLFLYGLERRVLLDAVDQRNETARAELPQIRDEVAELQSVYGRHDAVDRYIGAFIELLDLLIAAQSLVEPADPPAPPEQSWPISPDLRIGLGQFARLGRPVPANWALTWALSHPQIYPRTPAKRCPREFADLFAQRYTERCGAGLIIPGGLQRLTSWYGSASPSFSSTQVPVDLPDVVEAIAPTSVLREIVESCTDDLDAYSRWLGRTPDGQGTLEAAALLPTSLLATHAPQAVAIADWANQTLRNEAIVAIECADLAEHWTGDRTVHLTKHEAIAFGQLLDGFGIEPPWVSRRACGYAASGTGAVLVAWR